MMQQRHRLRRPLTVFLVLGACLTAGATNAEAHIQIEPTAAAPGDPVHFRLLVPGETDSNTTKVEMQVPAGVIPFSYQDVAGWKHEVVEAADGSIERIVWTGDLSADGFVELGFLASTPDTEGDLKWSALQTYADGTVVKWTGGPDDEEPAPVTVVSKSTPKQNAGGESSSEGSGDAVDPTVNGAGSDGATGSSDAGDTDDAGDDEAGSDTLARVLGGVGLGLGLIALVIAITGRRRRSA